MKVKTWILILLIGICAFMFCVMPVSAAQKQEDIVYTTEYLNVRREPSSEAERVGVLVPNSELTRVNEGNKWDTINIDGEEYFVFNEYITSEKPNEEDIVEVCDTNFNKLGDFLGKYKITAYCSCSICCGKNGGKITSSGTIPTVGRTVGCNSLPAGTEIIIDKHKYIVEDTGNVPDNVIDIYMESHEAALARGTRYNVSVYKAD